VGISTYTFIGPTVLKYYRGETEVGLYSAGYKLISILTLVPAAVAQVVYPIFSEFAAHTPHKLRKALQDALRVMFEISVPLAVGTILLAPRIISLIYPPEYAGGAQVLQIIIAGNALGFLGWIVTAFLLAIGRQTYCMWNSLVVAAAVVVADVLVIPASGYVGVAIVSAITEAVLFLSLTSYAWRQGFPVREPSTFLKILASAALMGGTVWAGSVLPLIPLVIGAALLYGLLLLGFRIIGDQERELAGKLLRLGRAVLPGEN
jgi:O-antigen/teichoic acid export membrane protein